MSTREELRMRRQQRARQKRFGLMTGTVVLAVAVIGFLIYQNSRPVGELVTIEKESLPYADNSKRINY